LASKFGGKRFAIGAGVVVALVAALAWLTRDPGPQRDSRGRPIATQGKSDGGGVSRWLPWMGKGKKAEPGQIPDPYKGPRVPVRVKVVDVEGNPVSGVTVEARVDPDEWEFAGLSEEEYDKYIEAKYAVEGEDEEPEDDTEESLSEGEEGDDEDWRVVRASVDSGRTGRDGVYTAQIKPDLDVVFHATDGNGREGVSPLLYVYLPDEEEEESEDVVPDDLDPYRKGDRFEVTIELAELGILAGVVVDDRGQPIAGAEVSLSPWGGDLESDDLIASEAARDQRTKEDGTFRIPLRASGAFDVEVHAPKFQPVVEQAVQVLPGRETALNITMLASAEIAGIVLDPRGTPVEGARVLVQGQPSPHEYVSSETNTDADGHFVIEELAPGRYTVAALADGFRPAEQWDVAAGGGEMTIRLTAGGKIHGDVVAARDLQVRPGGMIEPDENAENGETPGQLFFGDVYVSLHGPPMDPGEPIPVGVPLATGVPQGREIESPSGTLDVRGRYFTQLPLDETGRGTFDVEGLPPGTYDVTVMIGAAVGRRTQVRVWDGGTANVSMELPDRGAASIAGTIRSSDGRPLREATVFLYGALPSGLSAWADASGRFEFRSVPAGEYMLHAAATVPAKDGTEMLVTAYVATEVVKVPGSGRIPVNLIATPSDIPPDPDTIVIDLDSLVIDSEIPDPDSTEYTFENHEEEEADEELWMPDVWIEEIDTGLVVTYAPPAPNGTRLFGGDRVTSIDGASVTAMESWEALELLYGPKGSLCRITVERPASRETLSVSLPRDKDAYEMEGHIY